MKDNVFQRGFSAVYACKSCPIRSQAFCCKCTPSDMTEIEGHRFFRHFAPGEIVIMAGFEAPFVASIVEGAASMEITSPDGRSQGVALLLPPEMLGNPLRPNASFSVTALTEVTLCCIYPDVFQDFLTRHPAIGMRLLEMKLGDLDRARNWMMLLGRRNAVEKLAYFIIRVGQKVGVRSIEGNTSSFEIDMPLTRERMGAFLGLSTETVCRELAYLEREGILQSKKSRTIKVHDCRRLEAIAEISFDG